MPGPSSAFPQVPQTGSGQDSVPQSPSEDKEVQFVSFVLDDAQGFWKQQFAAAGKPYQQAKLVLFRDQVNSGCGLASSATGPFYCPLDQKVYIDLGFFDELNRRFKAPGDFAQAYVLAHEIGHHVQQQLGIEGKVRQQSQQNPGDANELSVRLELQADCFAGVWARSTYDRGILENGDLQEGLTAAAAVGDDRIQQQAAGRIDPETFTHGTSEQRAHWLQTGFDSGKLESLRHLLGRHLANKEAESDERPLRLLSLRRALRRQSRDSRRAGAPARRSSPSCARWRPRRTPPGRTASARGPCTAATATTTPS